MKTIKYYILLSSILCMTSCVCYDYYKLDVSNAKILSAYSTSLFEGEIPPIEHITIKYDKRLEAKRVTIKLSDKVAKTYKATRVKPPIGAMSPMETKQWEASDEFNKIIGAYSYDVLTILRAPDLPIRPNYYVLKQIIDDYRHQGKFLYFIHISKHNSVGTWYVYPIIKDKYIDIDFRYLIPEKKSYF